MSDPEGCSLHTLSPYARWKSRCSCSGSPTNSMLLALQSAAQKERQRSPLRGNGTVARHNGLPLFAPLPQRYSKILASVESDGLSSSTSSEWDLDYRLLETQQTMHCTLESDRHLAKKLAETCELDCNAHYSPGSLARHNTQRPGGNVSFVVPQRRSHPAPLDANCKSVLMPDEHGLSSQSCYPLLRMSSYEQLQSRHDRSGHPH